LAQYVNKKVTVLPGASLVKTRGAEREPIVGVLGAKPQQGWFRGRVVKVV